MSTRSDPQPSNRRAQWLVKPLVASLVVAGVLAPVLVAGCGIQSYSSKVNAASMAAATEPVATVPAATAEPAALAPEPTTDVPPPAPAAALTEAQRAALVSTRKPFPTAPLGFTLGGTADDFKATCQKLGGWGSEKDGVLACRGPNTPDFKAESVQGRTCEQKVCVLSLLPADKTPNRANKSQATLEQEYGAWFATAPEPECAMKDQTFSHHWLWVAPDAPAEARVAGSVELAYACEQAGAMPQPILIYRDAAGHAAHGKVKFEDLR